MTHCRAGGENAAIVVRSEKIGRKIDKPHFSSIIALPLPMAAERTDANDEKQGQGL